MAQNTMIIKKYGNRRLYDTEASRYITLEDLARLIRSGRDVRVLDARTREDLTKSVLLQIISEQEKDEDILPISFLMKVIQHQDASLRDAIRRHLTTSLDAFLDAQREFDQRYRAFAGNLLNPMMWMMGPLAGQVPPGPPTIAPPSPWPTPTRPPTAPGPAAPPPTAPDDLDPLEEAPDPLSDEPPPDEPEPRPEAEEGTSGTQAELKALKEQMAQMQALLARLAK